MSWTPEDIILCALSHFTAAEFQFNIKIKQLAALFFPLSVDWICKSSLDGIPETKQSEKNIAHNFKMIDPVSLVGR